MDTLAAAQHSHRNTTTTSISSMRMNTATSSSSKEYALRAHLDFVTRPHVDSFDALFADTDTDTPYGVYSIPDTDAHFGRLQVLLGEVDGTTTTTTTTDSHQMDDSDDGGGLGAALRQYIPDPDRQHSGLLDAICRRMRRVRVDHPRFADNRLCMELVLERLGVERPFVQVGARRFPRMPAECRAKGIDYTGRLIGTFRVNVYRVEDDEWEQHRQQSRGSTTTTTTTSSSMDDGDQHDEDDEDEEESGTDGSNSEQHRHQQQSRQQGPVGRSRPRQYTLVASYRFVQSLGPLPVMVRSAACNLRGLDSAQLVQAKEEPHESGGYYIVNGTEKVARMVISQRRNAPFNITRKSFARQEGFTDKGCLVKCVRADETIHLNQLHYAKDGTLHLSCGQPRKFFPLAVVLKALKDTSDREIYTRIIDGSTKTVDRERLELTLIEARNLRIKTRTDALRLIGQQFQTYYTAPYKTDLEVGQEFLDEYVLPFVTPDSDSGDTCTSKFDLLVFMAQKLLKFVNGEVREDDLDSIANHEVLTPGIVFANIVGKAVDSALIGIEASIRRSIGTPVVPDTADSGTAAARRRRRSGPLGVLTTTVDFFDLGQMASLLASMKWTEVAPRAKMYLATGNVPPMIGRIDLPQMSGLAIVGEKLNFLRFISHFRAIHRGAAFTESRTNDVRRLKVDAWGFICPAHSPDGALSGLLNHLTHMCEVSSQPHLPAADAKALRTKLSELGVSPLRRYNADYAPVFLDGVLIGSIENSEIVSVAEQLRHIKVTDRKDRFRNLEIAFVPSRPELDLRMVPGLFLLTHPARFMRPVRHLRSDTEELIGPTEQLFLHIAVVPTEIKKGITTHMECDPTNMFSNVAALTPFSDFNQSPRNVYQCQMGKQTMGFPLFTYSYRTDSTIYRISNPQAPIARTVIQDKLPFDDYLTGTNCIVAVLSYTGYDMEDAMIINRASYERGLHHGCVYKTQKIDLREVCDYDLDTLSEHDNMPVYFRNWQEDKSGDHVPFDDTIGCMDGLPAPGTVLKQDETFFVFYDEITHTFKRRKWTAAERGIVDNVKVVGVDASGRVYSVMITVRQVRNPVIGDKFSSRHGQKGVLSLLWPQEDMPFTESGMTPDIIINPHAFPSRMTIGMLIESSAAKSGALHGYYPDATPFHFDENYTAVDHYGEELRKAGYNYYGNEVLYSGVFGTELRADIFMGVVYYQRLRHMVADKFQARATGPVNRLTHQPVHGRKRGGGVRLGEMERDGILAYGASFMLRDRLFHNSDESFGHACRKCGTMLTVIRRPSGEDTDYVCKGCGTGDHLAVVEIPYVYKLLTNELAACNIGVSMKVD